MKAKKLLLIFITCCFSTTCEAQDFDFFFAKMQEADSLDYYAKGLSWQHQAWAAAGSDKEKQVKALSITTDLYYHSNLDSLELIVLDSLCQRGINLCIAEKTIFYQKEYFSFLGKKAFGAIDRGAYQAVDSLVKVAFHSRPSLSSYDTVRCWAVLAYKCGKQGNDMLRAKYYRQMVSILERDNIIDKYTIGLRFIVASFFSDETLLAKTKDLAEGYLGRNAVYVKYIYSYYGGSEGEEGIFYLKKVTKIDENRADTSEIAHDLFLIVDRYSNANNLDSSWVYFERLKTLVQAIKAEKLKKETWYCLPLAGASMEFIAGSYKNAIEKYNLFFQNPDSRELVDEYYTACNNIGIAYERLKDWENALKFIKRALYMANNPIDSLNFLSNLANLYGNKKDFKTQLDYAQKVKILADSLKITNKQWVLAYAYLNNERVEEGIALLKNALKTDENSSQDLTLSYYSLLLKGYRLTKQKDSITLYINVLQQFLAKTYQQNLPILPERNRFDFVQKHQEYNDKILSTLHDNPKDETLLAIGFNQTLMTKGTVLDYSMRWKKDLETSSNPALKSLFEQWQLVKTANTEAYKMQHFQQADSLANIATALEGKITLQSSSFRSINQQIEYQEVQNALKNDDVALEFVHFIYHSPSLGESDDTMYGVFILKKTSLNFVSLGNSKTIRDIIFDKYVYNNVPYHTYQKIWKPLEIFIGAAKNIYYAPSNLLELLSFDAICYSKSQYLSNRYANIRRLRNIRQLAIGLDDSPLVFDEKNTIMHFANPIFGAITEPIKPDNNSAKPHDCFEPISSQAANHYQKINAIIKAKKLPHDNHQGSDATEFALKNTLKNKPLSPILLSFYSHGYYENQPWAINKNALLSYKEPLLRSGIVLANGNDAWCRHQYKEGTEDGLLTAYEVSNMDLSHTKLVVLATCQSGRGDIFGNEGMLGLQRAMKMAGVKNMLVALWDLDPEFTAFFVEKFYTKVLNGRIPYQAFRETQKECSQNPVFMHPSKWGGIVFVQ